jgi:hypothetical protein
LEEGTGFASDGIDPTRRQTAVYGARLKPPPSYFFQSPAFDDKWEGKKTGFAEFLLTRVKTDADKDLVREYWSELRRMPVDLKFKFIGAYEDKASEIDLTRSSHPSTGAVTWSIGQPKTGKADASWKHKGTFSWESRPEKTKAEKTEKVNADYKKFQAVIAAKHALWEAQKSISALTSLTQQGKTTNDAEAWFHNLKEYIAAQASS